MADREKLINELANDIAFHCPDMVENGCGVYNCASCLAERLADDGYHKAVQEWISVKDRLPKESGEYLVFGRAFGNKKPQIWICECISIGSVMGWCNNAKNPVVEAWTPLPQPPKGE